MVTAIILITSEPGAVGEAAEELAKLPRIAEVYSVAGEWDLVAIARVAKNEELADLVTSELGNVAGVVSTETLIAFRSYSRHDLERMFSIGMED
ncbi:MAG: Lrp/AsnC family transcriptional regulator [Candidatus Eisenbacteria bacterium]|nr:Lrp/AsnC family transcriptional regulator [Candidatus Latescibacterota bacterium]MBD3303290.1 Lrp/AsnC family transcriptional regulator [Candidatus Eisenbacteria bacterium]